MISRPFALVLVRDGSRKTLATFATHYRADAARYTRYGHLGQLEIWRACAWSGGRAIRYRRIIDGEVITLTAR